MTTIAEQLMQEVLERLSASPALISNGNVRRKHRVTVARDDAPAVYLVDGTDDVVKSASDCLTDRKKEFVVNVFGRDDDGVASLDPIIAEINARLDGTVDAYPLGAVLEQGAITPDEEIADGDAQRVAMAFKFTYSSKGWSLEDRA